MCRNESKLLLLLLGHFNSSQLLFWGVEPFLAWFPGWENLPGEKKQHTEPTAELCDPRDKGGTMRTSLKMPPGAAVTLPSTFVPVAHGQG